MTLSAEELNERVLLYDDLAGIPTVYLLLNPLTGLVKIGWTQNIGQRVSTLQRACGTLLDIVGTISPCGTHEHIKRVARATERALHEKHAGLREVGEWFRDSPDIRADFPEWR